MLSERQLLQPLTPSNPAIGQVEIMMLVAARIKFWAICPTSINDNRPDRS